MSYAALPGQKTPPAPGSGLLERVWYFLTQSPQAQVSGLVNSGGLALAANLGKSAKTVVPRMLASTSLSTQDIAEGSPGLVKWIVDKSGKVRFGASHDYHEYLADAVGGMKNVMAGGVVNAGKVKVFRDLTSSPETSWDSIRQAVANAFKSREP